MADNKVTIDADYFAELYRKANNPLDEMERNYNAVIAAKDREIAAVKDVRDRLNAKVNELMKQKEAAERCIEDIETAIGERSIEMQGGAAFSIISAYRETKGDNQ